jgi:membrane-bound lytic murein transglycosylase
MKKNDSFIFYSRTRVRKSGPHVSLIAAALNSASGCLDATHLRSGATAPVRETVPLQSL